MAFVFIVIVEIFMADFHIERALQLLDRASICVAVVILVTYTVRLADFIRTYVNVCL